MRRSRRRSPLFLVASNEKTTRRVVGSRGSPHPQRRLEVLRPQTSPAVELSPRRSDSSRRPRDLTPHTLRRTYIIVRSLGALPSIEGATSASAAVVAAPMSSISEAKCRPRMKGSASMLPYITTRRRRADREREQREEGLVAERTRKRYATYRADLL
ncbi:hypothetical protein B296_00058748 [Ensete ventricosum]|uniref:Uncharacterized protein n=1 Tax=Ensete ventricosum TaxID=4639 RepID=A0A426XKR8_ENSVE|nr:hypothetical protein B296_00058748 [Ensete ventricosum]